MSSVDHRPHTTIAQPRPSPRPSEVVRDYTAVLAGRTVAALLHVVRPGGGTALPGTVAHRISPGLLARVLSGPREGIVVVTGSSGKSTTTQMVVGILRQHGLTVFTNNRTANITKGLVSELLPRLNWQNRIQVDVAVLEIDEGYSAIISEMVTARVSILLNVMIDQLHRWHEPERVAGYLARTAAATSQTVVVNADDPHLAAIGAAADLDINADATVRRFALGETITTATDRVASAPRYGVENESPAEPADSVVLSVEGSAALISIDGVDLKVALPSAGAHIASDAAAAIEGARALLGDRFDAETTRLAFQSMPGVAGRNERVTIGDHNVDFVFTKSPASMQLNLDLLDNTADQVMVAVGKDIYDTSQLWLVDWSTLPNIAVVSGWQAWDTALRLAYDEVPVAAVEPDVRIATRDFLDGPNPDSGHSTIIYTPESMRVMRRNLRLKWADTQ